MSSDQKRTEKITVSGCRPTESPMIFGCVTKLFTCWTTTKMAVTMIG